MAVAARVVVGSGRRTLEVMEAAKKKRESMVAILAADMMTMVMTNGLFWVEVEENKSQDMLRNHLCIVDLQMADQPSDPHRTTVLRT